jgi:hypothetical protein
VLEELGLVAEQDIAKVTLEALQGSVGGQGQVHLEIKFNKKKGVHSGKLYSFADQH